MTAPPPHKRARISARVAADEDSRLSTDVEDDSHARLRESLGETATQLAQYSIVARSLVTVDEDAMDAAAACCQTLCHEHGFEMDAAKRAIETLATLAEGSNVTWRDLPRIREHPLAAALAGWDEGRTEGLHSIAEMLQFPKRVSFLLQRQLAVFRVRRALSAGASDTAELIRGEAVLAPLLKQAETCVDHLVDDDDLVIPSGLPLKGIPAFWRGFFGDPESTASLDGGRRVLDHVAYGAGSILGRRGLLPDLLEAPAVNFVRGNNGLLLIAAEVGDVATVAALQPAGREEAAEDLASVAANNERLQVLRSLKPWGDNVDEYVSAVATAALPSSTLTEILSDLLHNFPSRATFALAQVAASGDVRCMRWLLERDVCRTATSLAEAARTAAEGKHIGALQVLLEAGAVLSSEVFQASGDVATLRWCMEHGHRVDAEFVKAAASRGWRFQLEWAATVSDVSGFLTADVFAAAAYNLPTCEWLHARGCPWDSRVLRAGMCKPDCLVFALRHGCPVDDFPLPYTYGNMSPGDLRRMFQALLDSGRGELVEFSYILQKISIPFHLPVAEVLACDLGRPLTAEDCQGWRGGPPGFLAAMRGCLRLLQHLCEKRLYTPGPADMRAVLASDHLSTRSVAVVRWLHARGVPTHGPLHDFESHYDYSCSADAPLVDTPEFIAILAARADAVELLQVLVEECGAPLTESACIGAAEKGRMETLRWAMGKGCPCGVDTWCAAVRRAGESDDYRPLALLYREKLPFSEAVWSAAAPFEEVRGWLLERFCPSLLLPALVAATGGILGTGAVEASAPRY